MEAIKPLFFLSKVIMKKQDAIRAIRYYMDENLEIPSRPCQSEYLEGIFHQRYALMELATRIDASEEDPKDIVYEYLCAQEHFMQNATETSMRWMFDMTALVAYEISMILQSMEGEI